MSDSIYTIAVEAALKEPLSYLPPEDGNVFQRGQSVEVPLGSRRVPGVVIDQKSDNTPREFKLKPIFQLVQDRPTLHEPFLKWAEWMAKYYFHPLGLVFDSVFPALPRFAKRKIKTKG